jgi:hypothetical protein
MESSLIVVLELNVAEVELMIAEVVVVVMVVVVLLNILNKNQDAVAGSSSR